ncbi:MAG: CHAT domain-containing protein, partial [Holophagales bacterium]|nr:CHAT domain-containing protein [Holophagales bacterium]
ELDRLAAELDAVYARVRASDPRFAQLVAPIDVATEALQAQLEPGSILLRYAFTERRGYLFVLGPDHWRTWTLPGRRLLDPQIEALYGGLQQARRRDLQIELAAKSLSRQLLPPGAVPAGTRHLILVGDGLLSYLPFAVLRYPADGDRLLMDELIIRYLPAAGLPLAAPPPRASEGSPAVAVFADPVFSHEDSRLRGGGDDPCGDEARPLRSRSIFPERLPADPLPRLPCTRREAVALLSRFTADRRLEALGFAARKRAVQQADLRRFQILHFATHAFIDEQYPDLSGLVLSRFDEAGRPIDGDLHLHEIFDLDLQADLVVLSGCQTALGRHVRGDGLLSMARGFFYAGGSNVLVSLWSVDDQATAELMTLFYEALLGRGEPPAEALRSAQLALRRHPRWRVPYFWAPWVLVSLR